MDWLVERVCGDIIAGCHAANIQCGFWTNVEIVADKPYHGAESVKIEIPLFVPEKDIDPAA